MSEAAQRGADELGAARSMWAGPRWGAAALVPWAAQRTLVEHLLVTAWKGTHPGAPQALAGLPLDASSAGTCLCQLVLALVVTSHASSLPVPATLSPAALLDPSVWVAHLSPEAMALEVVRAARRGVLWLLRWSSTRGAAAWPLATGALPTTGAATPSTTALAPGRWWGRMSEPLPGRRGGT